MLKNAKDACATEALEIATYTALERLAAPSATTRPRKLAASIRADEEKMLAARPARDPEADRRRRARRHRRQRPSYDIAKTGAADARPRGRRRRQGDRAQDDRKAAKRTARQARKVPGVAQRRGPDQGRRRLRGRPRDRALRLADGRGDHRSARPSSRRSTWRRSTPTSARTRTARRSSSRITSLRGDEPWAGYDELTVAEVQAVLSEGDDERVKQVRTYERAHKNRAGVLNAAERELANA